ncbi:arylsulfatase [Vibrio sp. WXL103]|uniref:arylsulfatase n=1 Tax=unclassified Vibrio TaxID=2614977 RepID=UPI003EC8E22C
MIKQMGALQTAGKATLLATAVSMSMSVGATAGEQVSSAATGTQPNVIFIFMDNLAYGELGVYGGGELRGAPTPRIDALADEGMLLTNFNVEAQCTPSRASLMTGRYPVRSGNMSVPVTTGLYGLTQWEYAMPEMFKDAGYATGMFGKWHLGHTQGRYPTDQGFDEWYGIPNSSDESNWPHQQQFIEVWKEGVNEFARPSYVKHAFAGQEPERIAIYDNDMRRELDEELTVRTIDFIKKNAAEEKPFFAYIPYTQPHYPVDVSREYDGKSGNGRWGDVLMQIDAYTGRILDAVDEAGIADNTIFIFTSDNGPEFLPGHEGWGGPWRGTHFTALEASLRVPFIMRWPGHVEAGSRSNEIIHLMDMFPTFANFVGGKVPEDRIIDGVDQSEFFLGNQEESNRDGFMIYVGNDIFGVKWRNWKMMFKEVDKGNDVKREFDFPRFYNLYLDPKEMYPYTGETMNNFWVRWPMSNIITEHLESFAIEPPIAPGTPDPYVPAK